MAATTRDRLLEEARRACREGGWEAVTTAGLCRALGLSQPAFYRHFPSLDELFVHLHVEVLDRLADAIDAARAGIEGPAERVRAAWRAYVNFALTEPNLFTSAFNRPAVPELEDEWRRRMQRGLAAIRADAGGDAVIDQWVAVHGLAELLISGRLSRRSAGGPDAILDRLLDHLA